MILGFQSIYLPTKDHLNRTQAKNDNSLKMSASLNIFKHNLMNQYFRIKNNN